MFHLFENNLIGCYVLYYVQNNNKTILFFKTFDPIDEDDKDPIPGCMKLQQRF